MSAGPSLFAGNSLASLEELAVLMESGFEAGP
jgi:hypothetical protein